MAWNEADWIGRSISRSDQVTERILAEYHATLGPYLFDSGSGDCPPGLHFGLAPPIPSLADTGEDGAERRGLFLPPIALPRRMWAGGLIETVRPLRPGARVRRTSTLTRISRKQGRSGELCLLSITHELADEEGLAIRDRQDLAFADAAEKLPPPGPAVDLHADWIIEATPLLLFRFSAMTFNGHRIHYDLAHAEAEGYPGLLVHGPLQASLLLNLAATRLGHVPERFSYRCLKPLYACAPFGVAFDTATATVRVIRADGVTTAEGQALPRETG